MQVNAIKGTEWIVVGSQALSSDINRRNLKTSWALGKRGLMFALIVPATRKENNGGRFSDLRMDFAPFVWGTMCPNKLAICQNNPITSDSFHVCTCVNLCYNTRGFFAGLRVLRVSSTQLCFFNSQRNDCEIKTLGFRSIPSYLLSLEFKFKLLLRSF